MLFVLAGVCINQNDEYHYVKLPQIVYINLYDLLRNLQTYSLLEQKEQGFFYINRSRLTDALHPGSSYIL